MNIQEYIASGILESYCLGILTAEEQLEVERACMQYPEIAAELEVVQHTLENYAQERAIAPDPRLAGQVKNTLLNLEKEKVMDPKDLPLINAYSDHRNWLGLVRDLLPEEPETGRTANILRNSDGVLQMLLVSATDFDDEVHEDLHESFLILEGECECIVGERVFRLQAGGFTEIPLYTPHSVTILSPFVSAILQRVDL